MIATGREQETRMAQMIVLYKTPKDTAAFDQQYAATHIPLAKKSPASASTK
jgi:uncharacterized protein (TIGR02118 family)